MDRSNETVTSGQIPEAKSGYDLDLFGINDGSFVLLHSLALTCLGLSILSALCVIVDSTTDRGLAGFFSWTKSERFVFYMACTETILDITHLLDHSQILVTRDHVRPVLLCQAYGFVLYNLAFAQVLSVSVIAVTVFLIIYMRKNVEYGSGDWKVFLGIFVFPFTSAVVLASLGQFGTNTSFCLFDAVRGQTGNLVVAIPMMVILVTNTFLYGLTWYRVRKETRDLEVSLGPRIEATRRSHRVARNLFLFLIVYFIQWWPASLLSILLLFPNPPLVLIYFVTTFSNIGGILNGFVYFVIRRRRHTSNLLQNLRRIL